DMAGLKFSWIAHVENIERAGIIGAPAFDRRAIDAPDPAALRHAPRRLSRPIAHRRRDVRRAAVLALFAGKAFETPAHGAVPQRHHLIRQTGIDQRLRADDAARAAGAI